MILGLGLGAAMAVAATALPPSARAHWIYFHKPGVGRDAFAIDALYCQSLAEGVQAPTTYQPYSSNAYAAGTAALLSGFMKSRARRGMIENVLRTCMADRGYRRIEAPNAIGEALEKLPEAERLDRMAELAGADEPKGKVLPR